MSRATRTKILLLGAGASVEAGVPAAKAMVRTVYSRVRQLSDVGARALEVAIGGLRMFHSFSHAAPFGDVDVEDMYQILRLLADRNQSLLSPFVGSWSTAVTQADRNDLGAAAARVAEQIAGQLQRLATHLDEARDDRAPYFGYSEMAGTVHALTEALRAASSEDGSAFGLAAELVIRAVMTTAWLFDVSVVEYLMPLILSSTKTRLWIASLNYDNSVELAAQAYGAGVDVGVGSGKKTVKFDDSSDICLAKLHGSVDWYLPPDGTVEILHGPSDYPALIFGSGNKLRIDGPYLDLLFEFRSRLSEHSTLVTCGYSFRDPHVNHILLRWLDDNSSRKMCVKDPAMSVDDLVANFAAALPYGDRVDKRKLANRIELERVTTSRWISKEYGRYVKKNKPRRR